MIYTDLTKLAMRIAYEAHEGQTDRGGVPYINHPLHVADGMEDEATTVIALLHDVIEDSEITGADLVKLGIPEEYVASVQLLSRDREAPYADYIESIIASGDTRAITVKYADLCHNTDESRTRSGKLPQRLIERYTKAKARIEEVLQTACP